MNLRFLPSEIARYTHAFTVLGGHLCAGQQISAVRSKKAGCAARPDQTLLPAFLEIPCFGGFSLFLRPDFACFLANPCSDQLFYTLNSDTLRRYCLVRARDSFSIASDEHVVSWDSIALRRP